MKHKHIIKSLPLLASILGRKYGVQVRIGGDSAHTDGKVIQLPGLPLDCDDSLLGLIRGYLDHEAAHIRDTDFGTLKTANLTPLEKHIWNVIEDWRVENVLSAIYPGCRENFQWLIKHFFLPESSNCEQQAPAHPDPALSIPEWLLVTVRSWDVQELNDERDVLRTSVESHYPGLTHELEPVLRIILKNCASTLEAFGFACEIVNIIRKYAHFLEQRQDSQQSRVGQEPPGASPEASAGASADPSGQRNDQGDPAQALQSLQNILSAGTDESVFPEGMGEKLREMITDACGQQGERFQVAVVTNKPIDPLEQADLDSARQATTALRTRLQALLQSTRSVRNHSSYAGALDTRKLHSLATGNTKIFLRKGEKIGMNTAIHILIDSSGSMYGRGVRLASQACFALASALHGVRGINIGVSTFPGAPGFYGENQKGHWQTITPVLRHGEKMHSRFNMTASGETPMDAALWWVMQQLYPMPEPRKIILLITDGRPDNTELALAAIRAVKDCGWEIYGIGIADFFIQSLLPGKESKVINDIAELAPLMFDMLQTALFGKREERIC